MDVGVAGIDVGLVGATALNRSGTRVGVVEVLNGVFEVRGSGANVSDAEDVVLAEALFNFSGPLPDIVVAIAGAAILAEEAEHEEGGR